MLSVCAALFADEPTHVTLDQLDRDVILIGKLHRPLGTLLTLKGVAVDVDLPEKSLEEGLHFRVQQIDGEAHQSIIEIRVQPYSRWDTPAIPKKYSLGKAPSKPKAGQYYELRGYETGSYVGVPPDAYKGARIARPTATVHYFTTRFIVISATPIDRFEYTPAMFPEANALLTGTAVTQSEESRMAGEGFTVIVDPGNPWPDDVEGKKIETLGHYIPTPAAENTFELKKGHWRLARLEDQIGKRVALKLHRSWREKSYGYSYRGTPIELDLAEPIHDWPYGYGRFEGIEMEGVLEKADGAFLLLDAARKRRSPLLSQEYPAHPYPR